MWKKIAMIGVVAGLSMGSVACVGDSVGSSQNGNGGGQNGSGQNANGQGAGSSTATGGVQINGRAADASELARLEGTYGVKVAPGSYWHDRRSGLAGRMGSYPQAYAPGFDFGAVPRNASNGNTAILYNGRELNMAEAVMIANLLGVPASQIPAYAGSYILESNGDVFTESGSFIINLVQVAMQRGQASSGGGGGDNFWSTGGAYGNSSGGCSYITIPSSSGAGSTSVSSGC